MKKFSPILIAVIMLVLGLEVGQLSAGSPEPPGGPTAFGAQMHTLQQIYDRISNGGEFHHPHMSTFTEPSTAPGIGTTHTLSEIYFLLGQSAHVRRSGQTKCYDPGGGVTPCPNTGMDGELRRGAVWPSPRFTNNNNGTVTDNLSGLIWLRNANCAGGTRDWGTALGDIDSLNNSG